MVSARGMIWTAAVLAVLARFPSALWPLRPDEAGFLLVARAWDPQPDNMFGHFWVDRPPLIIALTRLSDWIGGPYFLRVIAALGCAVVVLSCAGAGRRLASYAGVPRPERVAAWTAWLALGLVSTAMVDAVSAKGEVLGIPLVAASCWLALEALIRPSWRCAALAGLLAMSAVGFKQNMVGGLVFGGVLLVVGALAARVTWPQAARLAGAALAGAAVPVVATIAWALAEGVRLSTLWYMLYGFRADAYETIASQPTAAPDERAGNLLMIFCVTGMALVVLWLLLNMPRVLGLLPVTACAVIVMLAVDGAGVVLSGSYWRTYLVILVPPIALALAIVLVADEFPSRRTHHRTLALMTRSIVVLVLLSSLTSLVEWTVNWARGAAPTEYWTGAAIGAAAKPGDTLVVYGGRADIQFASGLPSPYRHLWSLPMRTLDPGLKELRALLRGPDAPTWFVEFTELDTWSETGTRPIERELIEDYQAVGTACGQYRIYHLNEPRPTLLAVDCDDPWRAFLDHAW